MGKSNSTHVPNGVEFTEDYKELSTAQPVDLKNDQESLQQDKGYGSRGCVVCGREFRPSHPRQIFCSPTCSRNNERRKAKRYFLAHGDQIRRQARLRNAKRVEREREARWSAYVANLPDPGLPAAEQLRLWLRAKGWTVRRLADELGIVDGSASAWLTGRYQPSGEHLRKLHELTGLDCFAVDTEFPQWARNLMDQARKYIASRPLSSNAHRVYTARLTKIVKQLATQKIENAAEIVPSMLLRNLPGFRSTQSQRRALKLFGNFMVHAGYWKPDQVKELVKGIEVLYGREPFIAFGSYQPNKTAARLLVNLIRDVGLRTSDVRLLKVEQFDKCGLDLGPRGIVPYGSGLHAVSKDALDAWQLEATPKDFLFYRRGDYHSPTSNPWLIQIARQGGLTMASGKPLHLSHYDLDFLEYVHPGCLRGHIQRFHGLTNVRSGQIAEQLQHKGGDLLPAPFLVAIVAIAQLADCTFRKVPGGRAWAATWTNAVYSISVQWPKTLALPLKEDRRRRARIGRELLRLALDYRRQRFQLHSFGLFSELDRSLATKLELVRVAVSERHASGRSWQGSLLARRRFLVLDETRRERRYFSIPLLEDLWGGEANGRCEICVRIDRAAIDEKIRHGMPLHAIAKHHHIPYGPSGTAYRFARHLRWHAGRLRSHGVPLESHVGHASAASLVKIPTNFLVRVARENATNLGRAILALDTRNLTF